MEVAVSEDAPSENGSADNKCAQDTCRVVVRNWPKFLGPNDGKKLFKSVGLTAKKICPVRDRLYATMDSQESCRLAIEKLTGRVMKKRTLSVQMAPMDWSKSAEGVRQLRQMAKLGTIEEAVTPWHDVPYEEQLQRKRDDAATFLKSLLSKIQPVSGEQVLSDGILEDIRASPAICGYRNKCTFTVGYNDEGRPQVGFRLSRHQQSCVVAPVDQCKHVPDCVKYIVNHFQENILLASDKPPYDVDTRQGFWRLLTVRCYSMDLMVIVTVNPTGIEADDVADLKKHLVDALLYYDLEKVRVSSVFFQELVNSSDAEKYELLGGCPYVYESLYDFSFRISPSSFFQVNSRACEVLYSVIAELCAHSGCEVLLDICCGTGTIGICVSKHVKKVYGVEIVAEAVEDAKVNAASNKALNCRFTCGRAEDLISSLINNEDIKMGKCVAVLDPPRAGIGTRVLVALRTCPNISHVIYVSCEPRAALKNFVDLCRQTSNRYQGQPFRLSKIIPVDMFPLTKHYEMVMMFTKTSTLNQPSMSVDCEN